jgi:hypothetical protein
MAASMAHRELTVRLGLEWLSAAGHFQIEGDAHDILLLPGNAVSNKEVQAELRAGLQSLLEETAAFREYFAQAAAESLLEN